MGIILPHLIRRLFIRTGTFGSVGFDTAVNDPAGGGRESTVGIAGVAYGVVGVAGGEGFIVGSTTVW